jgi:hypothetical protein
MQAYQVAAAQPRVARGRAREDRGHDRALHAAGGCALHKLQPEPPVSILAQRHARAHATHAQPHHGAHLLGEVHRVRRTEVAQLVSGEW